jgi:hypothetical protein
MPGTFCIVEKNDSLPTWRLKFGIYAHLPLCAEQPNTYYVAGNKGSGVHGFGREVRE